MNAEMTRGIVWEDVLCFVAGQGYASACEIMNEFHVTYAQSVAVMDRLEDEGVVETLSEYGDRVRVEIAAGERGAHDAPSPRKLRY